MENNQVECPHLWEVEDCVNLRYLYKKLVILRCTRCKVMSGQFKKDGADELGEMFKIEYDW